MRIADSALIVFPFHPAGQSLPRGADPRTVQGAPSGPLQADTLVTGRTAPHPVLPAKPAEGAASVARGLDERRAVPVERQRVAHGDEDRRNPGTGAIQGGTAWVEAYRARMTPAPPQREWAEQGGWGIRFASTETPEGEKAFLFGGKAQIRMANGREINLSVALGITGPYRRSDEEKPEGGGGPEVSVTAELGYRSTALTRGTGEGGTGSSDPLVTGEGAGYIAGASHWIDERDPVFDRIRVYMKDGEGKTAYTLRELNVTAIRVAGAAMGEEPDGGPSGRNEKMAVDLYRRSTAAKPGPAHKLDVTV